MCTFETAFEKIVFHTNCLLTSIADSWSFGTISRVLDFGDDDTFRDSYIYPIVFEITTFLDSVPFRTVYSRGCVRMCPPFSRGTEKKTSVGNMKRGGASSSPSLIGRKESEKKRTRSQKRRKKEEGKESIRGRDIHASNATTRRGAAPRCSIKSIQERVSAENRILSLIARIMKKVDASSVATWNRDNGHECMEIRVDGHDWFSIGAEID